MGELWFRRICTLELRCEIPPVPFAGLIMKRAKDSCILSLQVVSLFICTSIERIGSGKRHTVRSSCLRRYCMRNEDWVARQRKTSMSRVHDHVRIVRLTDD